MKEILIDELLKLQVEILKKVDSFCRDNSISYTVFGGTCIGAIRHKGYIPWDDDIDIAMTRPNYDRFIKSFNGKVDNLEVFAPELNWNYYAPYANVCDVRTILYEGTNGHNGIDIGVKIDVFPIDGVAKDLKEYHANKQEFAKLWEILYAKRRIINKLLFKGRIRSVLMTMRSRYKTRHCSYSEIQQKVRKLIVKYPYENAEFVDLSCYPWPSDSRCPRNVFEEYMDVPFENIVVSIIKGYDEYMTRAYGDYMKLPPFEKRIPHHHFAAYWKD